MTDYFKETILKVTAGLELYELCEIQQLWSGYGKIVRYGIKGSKTKSVIAKHVRIPESSNHPRGWNTDLSHVRKVKSYQVEMAWYTNWSNLCTENCRVPNCLALESDGEEILILLEDLDASGYSVRKTTVAIEDIETCLTWLAHFHATFMNEKPTDLWDVGTYWQLDTRPDELHALTDMSLKKMAAAINNELNNSPFKTFVHGDAKLANFCFATKGSAVSAVDFQYVGGGCGMKDVAYFIGSCLYDDDCEKWEKYLLDFYFIALRNALQTINKTVDFLKLEENWRYLYPFAWTDFHRFLKGWSPGHWKINSYSEKIARSVIERLAVRD